MMKLKGIKAIAFDLDGTLVDSVPGLANAVRLALTDLSLPSVTNDQVKSWVGNGVDKLLTRALLEVKAPITLLPEIRTGFDAHYVNTIQDGTVLFPHVKETLDKLKGYYYPLALVTNKPSQFLPDLLSSLGLNGYFSLVLGGDDVIRQKPHPAPLYQVLATFGLYAEELLFVGDSKNDILAAQQAHCPAVGLTYGYNYGESIAYSQPDFVVEKFEDILSLIDK